MPQNKVVEIKGIGVVEFPADMSDADIVTAIERDIFPAQQQAQPAQPPATLGSAFKALLERQGIPIEAGIGALKGAGSTAFGLGKLARKTPGLGAALKAIAPDPGGVFESEPEILKPQGTAQKIGFGAERIGEFFVPGAAATKVAKAATGLPALAKAAAKSGLQTGAVQAAQTGGDLPSTATAAGIGAAVPPLAGAIAAMTKPLAEQFAPKIINSILKPEMKAFNFGRDPGAGVVKEGLTANSKGGLLSQITEKKNIIGQQIDEKLTEPVAQYKRIEVRDLLLGPINNAIANARKTFGADPDLVPRLESFKDAMVSTIATATKGKTRLTPVEVANIKREIGSNTKWSGAPYENELNQLRVAIYRQLNDAIEAAIPGVKALNARYANMITAEKALERVILRDQNKAILDWQTKLGGVVSLGTGSVSAGAATVAMKMMGATPGKTRIAQAIEKLSKTKSKQLRPAANVGLGGAPVVLGIDNE